MIKVILSIIIVIVGIVFVANAYDGYQQAQKDVEDAKYNVDHAMDDCLKQKNDYIAQFGALPSEYENVCETK